MYHKSKYGGAIIRDHVLDNLQISWDYWDDIDDKKQRKAVLLYTPHMADTNEHYHIELDQIESRRLFEWLRDFLDDVKL